MLSFKNLIIELESFRKLSLSSLEMDAGCMTVMIYIESFFSKLLSIMHQSGQLSYFDIFAFLAHFTPLALFCTPWKHQETRSFPGSIEREFWHKMGQGNKTVNILLLHVILFFKNSHSAFVPNSKVSINGINGKAMNPITKLSWSSRLQIFFKIDVLKKLFKHFLFLKTPAKM